MSSSPSQDQHRKLPCRPNSHSAFTVTCNLKIQKNILKNNSSAKRRTILDIALMCKSCKNTAGAKRNVGNGENVASKMAALHELQELDRVCVWEMLQDLDRVCVWEMLQDLDRVCVVDVARFGQSVCVGDVAALVSTLNP